MREDVILENEVVRDGHRQDDDVRLDGRQRRVDEPGLRILQLAAVAASAFRIQKQVVLLQHLGDVRLERDEVCGIFGVAPDRNRAGDVLVDQAERSAEQVDAGRDERRPDAAVVEDDRLDQIVDVALVVRRVDDAMIARRVDRVVRLLRNLLDFSENWIQRMLQRAIHLVSLRSTELVEIAVNAFERGFFVLFAVSAAQIFDDFVTREDRL